MDEQAEPGCHEPGGVGRHLGSFHQKDCAVVREIVHGLIELGNVVSSLSAAMSEFDCYDRHHAPAAAI
jgi:hypothetical protein